MLPLPNPRRIVAAFSQSLLLNLHLLLFCTFIPARTYDTGEPAPTILGNQLISEPSVQCGSHSLSIDLETVGPFTGRIFVKGYSQDAGCRMAGDGSSKNAFSIHFDQCGLRRTREPTGVSISTTVVVSFHPIFITKIDRAYRLNCFYMEARKGVSQDLDVSMLTTRTVQKQADMPVCRYEILSGSSYGSPVRYAKIGDQVYHKWSCTTPTEDIYCMRVHSCTVNDGQGGEQVYVLDENGCQIDAYVLKNLEYTGDLAAGQLAYVFKFADKPSLHFNCQVELTLKDQRTGCTEAQPQCGVLPSGAGGYGASSGGKNTESGYNSVTEAWTHRPVPASSPSGYEQTLRPAQYLVTKNAAAARQSTANPIEDGGYSATTIQPRPSHIYMPTQVSPSRLVMEEVEDESTGGYTDRGNRRSGEVTRGPPSAQPPSDYNTEAPVNLSGGGGRGAGYNRRIIKRDNTKKVADFDLPEQSLVVIELGDDPNAEPLLNPDGEKWRSNGRECVST
ncbi:CUT-4 protein, partial [Aphelenchoides avenae]